MHEGDRGNNPKDISSIVSSGGQRRQPSWKAILVVVDTIILRAQTEAWPDANVHADPDSGFEVGDGEVVSVSLQAETVLSIEKGAFSVKSRRSIPCMMHRTTRRGLIWLGQYNRLE